MEEIKCTDKECSFKTRVEKQMDTHRRIKHIDVIRFSCDKCDYNSSTKNSLEEDEKVHHSKTYSCEECNFGTKTEGELKEHKERDHAKKQMYG